MTTGNVVAVAEAGVGVISAGRITHSAPVLDTAVGRGALPPAGACGYMEGYDRRRGARGCSATTTTTTASAGTTR